MLFIIQTLCLLFIACSLPSVSKAAISSLRGKKLPSLRRWPHYLGMSPSKKVKRSPKPSAPAAAYITAEEETQHIKEMYYKLHNLEQHPSILPQARDTLISFFAETIASATTGPDRGILALDTFDEKRLAAFLKTKDDKITQKWEEYLAKRGAGGPREMFRDGHYAKWFLKQSAPNKYVDGAWLGHIHKVTTPFALRRITKNAFQVFSEELGDGDLTKNHAFLFASLMREIDARLPDGDSAEFIGDATGLDQTQPWKSALSQLLISLFPHEFLPEILGFNMHFEMLTWDTMRAIRELDELKINSYYYLLHISIDNADSGHTAMAMQVVVDYINHVKRTEGSAAAHKAWKRVQAGFILSDSLPSSPGSKVENDPLPSKNQQPNELEAEVIKAFKAKAPVAHKLHCGSRVSIKRRSLVDWLEPTAFQSEERQMEFLNALANSKPWVRKGDPQRSKLMQSLLWDGKMFGSFTQSEVEALGKWIESLAKPLTHPNVYWEFTKRDIVSSDHAFQSQDVRIDYPVISPSDDLLLMGQPKSLPLSALSFSLDPTVVPSLNKFLPLWFTHPCLLESIISIPYKAINQSSSAVLRVLRAQYGFAPEGSGVAGMDEVRRLDSVDVIQLGLEMINAAGMSQPACLKDVLDGRESDFAVEMLRLSMRPMENRDLLIGLAWAFMNLHESFAALSADKLLSVESKKILGEMAARERAGLQMCLDEAKAESSRYLRFCQGFEMGKAQIESCFS